MSIKMQPFVLQHQCLRFAAIAFFATRGLDKVLKNKILPTSYTEVFLEGAVLCKDIVDNLYCELGDSINPRTLQFYNKSDAALWFYSLIKHYSKIYECLENYESILEIGETLEHIANSSAGRLVINKKKLREQQMFFSSICDAIAEEFRAEGVVGKIDFASFYKESKLSH